MRIVINLFFIDANFFQFEVDVEIDSRVAGSGRGHSKKEAEQMAARQALEQIES